MSAPNKTLRLMHFYNNDGFVHYTSAVVPGVTEPPDCRVADVVRSLQDVCGRTLGILPSTVAPETLREVMSPTAMNLALEDLGGLDGPIRTQGANDHALLPHEGWLGVTTDNTNDRPEGRA